MGWPYRCGVCGYPIVDEDPHTMANGDDCHEDCCLICTRGYDFDEPNLRQPNFD